MPRWHSERLVGLCGVLEVGVELLMMADEPAGDLFAFGFRPERGEEDLSDLGPGHPPVVASPKTAWCIRSSSRRPGTTDGPRLGSSNTSREPSPACDSLTAGHDCGRWAPGSMEPVLRWR